MKRTALITTAIALMLAVGFWSARRSAKQQANEPWDSPTKQSEVTVTTVGVTAFSAPAAAPPGRTEPFLGETILHGYANTNLPPENDLTLMSRLMENSLLLLKSAANHPLSANEDWAGLFLGQNSARESFLPAQHVALNSHGQLVDRWGTPLFFHALGSGRYEVRSAGPDKELWTADDIQRNSDGSFHHGAAMNPGRLKPAGQPATR